MSSKRATATEIGGRRTMFPHRHLAPARRLSAGRVRRVTPASPFSCISIPPRSPWRGDELAAGKRDHACPDPQEDGSLPKTSKGTDTGVDRQRAGAGNPALCPLIRGDQFSGGG